MAAGVEAQHRQEVRELRHAAEGPATWRIGGEGDVEGSGEGYFLFFHCGILAIEALRHVGIKEPS